METKMKLSKPSELVPKTRIAIFTSSAFKSLNTTPHTLEELERAFNSTEAIVGFYTLRKPEDKDDVDEMLYFARSALVAWAIAEVPESEQLAYRAKASDLTIVGSIGDKK